MSYKLQVILGLLDSGGEQVPFPVIAVDCPNEAVGQGLGMLATKWQNGQDSFSSSAPGCYFGDSFFRVAIGKLPSSQKYLLEVWGKAPHHLTHILVATGQVSTEEYGLFKKVYSLTESYTLTLAVEGNIRLDLLNLVKYLYHDKPIRPAQT